MRNFVKCFLEIEKDGVCLYSIIDIVCKIVYELDKLDKAQVFPSLHFKSGMNFLN